MYDEHAMLMFARLAAVSAERGQQPGRDRFLILTGLAATRAGWLDVAVRCHELVTASAPHHLLARYPSFAEALRDADFETYARQIRRFCTPEQAEHLLAGLGLPTGSAEPSQTAGTLALDVLCRISISGEAS